MWSGWGAYSDASYTSGSPFLLAANTDTALPNDGALAIEGQLPSDVPAFYDAGTQRLLGRVNDGMLITFDFTATPTTAAATQIEMWFDIGGSIGKFFDRVAYFTKGAGVPRPIVYTTAVYVGSTWEANGAEVRVRSDGPVNLYGMRYVVHRIHKAR